jgi:hypothetical protein
MEMGKAKSAAVIDQPLHGLVRLTAAGKGLPRPTFEGNRKECQGTDQPSSEGDGAAGEAVPSSGYGHIRRQESGGYRRMQADKFTQVVDFPHLAGARVFLWDCSLSVASGQWRGGRESGCRGGSVVSATPAFASVFAQRWCSQRELRPCRLESRAPWDGGIDL